MKLFSLTVLLLTVSNLAIAAGVTTSANSTPVNLAQTIISLIVVVGALIGLSILFKKFGLNRMNSTLPIKVIGAVHIGNNQRIVVIDAGEERIVLGVTPHHISTITTLPRSEDEVTNTTENSLSARIPPWLRKKTSIDSP